MVLWFADHSFQQTAEVALDYPADLPAHGRESVRDRGPHL
jgi:hypothetical protein